MDPLSVVALAGLVAAGRALSKKETYDNPKPYFGNNINTAPDEAAANQLAMRQGAYVLPAQSQLHKEAVPNYGVVAPNTSRNPNGQPVYNYNDRQNITTRMNSVQPVEKQYVGAGLGVGADVPAAGGFQQLYRVMPNNVGAYKLTQLPGRTGPSNPVVKRSGMVGELTQQRPEKTAAIWERRPPVKGRAGGQGGVLTGAAGHQNFEKTKRQTNRSTTTMRDDGLQYGAAGSIVSAVPVDDMPSRNKGDLNTARINDIAAPGISNFEGGYTQDPALLTGIRPALNRGNVGRAGGAGRMNVRMDPLNQGGVQTAMRSGAYRSIEGPQGTTGSANQTYQNAQYHQFNAFKGNKDFRTSNLDLAKNQGSKNPLNINFS